MSNLSRLFVIPALLFAATVSAHPVNNRNPFNPSWSGPSVTAPDAQAGVSVDRPVSIQSGWKGRAANPLVDMVSRDAGVSRHQAREGLGLLFNLSQQRMTQQAFQELTRRVPQAHALLWGGREVEYMMPDLLLSARTSPRLDPNLVMQMMRRIGYTRPQVDQMLQVVERYLKKQQGGSVNQVSGLFRQSVEPLIRHYRS